MNHARGCGASALRPLHTVHTHVACVPPIRSVLYRDDANSTFPRVLAFTDVQNHTFQYRRLPCYIPFTALTAITKECSTPIGGFSTLHPAVFSFTLWRDGSSIAHTNPFGDIEFPPPATQDYGLLLVRE